MCTAVRISFELLCDYTCLSAVLLFWLCEVADVPFVNHLRVAQLLVGRVKGPLGLFFFGYVDIYFEKLL